MREELQGRFGPDIYDAQGVLQRQALGAKVFGDPQALEDLNAITHRYIHLEIQRLLAKAQADGKQVAVVDAIALIESGLADTCQVTVAVVAGPETRTRRIMAREGISEEYARKRIAAQPDDAYFARQCDLVLVNDFPTRAEFEAYCRDKLMALLPQNPASGPIQSSSNEAT